MRTNRSEMPSLLAMLALLAGIGMFAPATARAQEDVPPEVLTEDVGEDPAEEASASDRQVSAAQAIADLARARRGIEAAYSLSRIDNLLSYEFKNRRGPSEGDVIRDAAVDALLATAARVYFDDKILVGRDLLEPYFRVYGERFVARRTVDSRRILADGANELDLRIGVDVDRLMADLEEKRFIAKPSVRPIVAVVISETIDDVPDEQGRGRISLENALRDSEMRVETERMGSFPLAQNLVANSEDLSALRLAREEADRGEVEILVTGSLEVSSRGAKDILYDNFTFYTAYARLQMIRVDSGEVVRTTNQSFAASALSPDAALAATFERLMPRCAVPLTDGFLEEWRNRMLDAGEYRLMITGAGDEELEAVFNLLRTMSPDVRPYLKAHFGDVAVVNVFHPQARPGRLEEILRTSRVPQFVVRPADERRFELRVH